LMRVVVTESVSLSRSVMYSKRKKRGGRVGN
jgi:hypothetical protein